MYRHYLAFDLLELTSAAAKRRGHIGESKVYRHYLAFDLLELASAAAKRRGPDSGSNVKCRFRCLIALICILACFVRYLIGCDCPTVRRIHVFAKCICPDPDHSNNNIS